MLLQKPKPHCLVKREAKIEREKTWQAVRKAVRLREGHRCRVAGFGAHEGLMEAHHVKPRSQGREDTTANVIWVCAFHHRLLQTHVIRPEFLSKRGADGPMAFSGRED